MKKQLFILILLSLTLTNIAFAQDAIGDFLKQKGNSGLTSEVENQLQNYFNAIVNRDAEGIYKFMNPKYAQTFANKNKALEMIRDEFKLMDSDNLKIMSVKIKPDAQKSLNITSTGKIGIDVEVADLKGKDGVTVDGELTAKVINNKWYFYHKNFYINSLRPYGMVRATDEEDSDDESQQAPKIETTNSGIYDSGMVNGKAISMPAPQYPKAASAVGASGAVNVEVIIDESGNVVSAEAISGHALLRQSAVDAAKQAKFKSTIVDGQARKVKGTIVYNFSK